jgi:spermidine/putrescine transport system ATP-binding protein
MIDVELQNVSKKYGKVLAVQQVSLSVEQGEFLTLLGPSGCGKTTTMRLIAGLETPTEGMIVIKGKNMTHLPPYKRDVSLMFQNYALFPHKTVFDNVAFGLKYRKTPKQERGERVERALELVHLPGIEKRYPRQLSGGQQQRVALARALVVNPAVLLLDEPLSNLDLKLRERMRVELKQIQEKVGITFIFVTHDQEEALTLSDRVAVMEDGKLIQIGSPREIYERPQTEFVARFIGQSNILFGVVQETAANQMEFITEKGMRFRWTPTSEISPGEQVAIQIRAERVHVYLRHQPVEQKLSLLGVIERVIYAGNSVFYYIQEQDGESILSICPTSAETPLLKDTPVSIGIDPQDFVVLRGKK